MSSSYFNETQKLVRFERIPWTWEEQDIICEILEEKGYIVSVVSRLGCDRKAHDSWSVEREDVPYLIEQCFRQRLHVEAQAEGHGKASLIFVYDTRAHDIIDKVRKFQRRGNL